MKSWSSLPDAAHNIQKDTRTISRRSAIFIGTMVDSGTDKTTQEEEVGSVDLYSVKASFFCPDGGGGELPDYELYIIRSHFIRFDLQKASFDIPIVGSKGKLRDDGSPFCVNDIRQSFILWNEGVITEPHHAAKVVVVKAGAGKAGDKIMEAVRFSRFLLHFNTICDIEKNRYHSD